MAIVYLSLLVCGIVTGGVANYGCVFVPELCTPPQHCDSFTGRCYVPVKEYNREFKYEEKALLRALQRSKYRDNQFRQFRRDLTVEYELQRYEEELEKTRNIRELLDRMEEDFRLAKNSKDNAYEYDVPSPLKNEKMNVHDLETQRYIEELVDKVKADLALRNMRLSDLTDDQLEELARYLADDVRRKQREKNTHFSVESQRDPISKDTAENGKDAYSSLTSSVDKKEREEVENVISDKSETVPAFDKKNVEPVQIIESPDDQQGLQLDVKDVQKAAQNSATTFATRNSSKAKAQRYTLYVVIFVVGATVLLIIIVTIITCLVHAYRTKKQEDMKYIRTMTSDETEPLDERYEELCRQHYATKNSDAEKSYRENADSVHGLAESVITKSYPLTKPAGNGLAPSRQESGSSHTNATRNSSVSSISWSEEPVTANLDISMGHAVLSYMEDHLNNKDRLDKEWEDICGYEADSITTAEATTQQNSRKNRSVVALPYDHNRIKLDANKNHVQSDYINASKIIDNDPKRPLYIAAQGPLPSTIPDFWQMMWERQCVAIVMLTPLVEEGVNQCARYWPDEGSCTFHNFEIHLVSEHIWCEDYLVRSLYLKHLGTGETRTVTQFHFLSWPKDRVPSSPKPLLELRRKVTKCSKGHNSPVLVHCSDGVSRTGTYVLLDLAIDRMLKGAKEIDIAATLEHIRDQRVGMVATKEQFEFALTAVAEEVNAILKTLQN